MPFGPRYLLLLLFILIVIAAMFFIYSNVNSAEMVVYFNQTPTWRQKASCIIRGGALEAAEGFEYSDQTIDSQEKGDKGEMNTGRHYLCHYH